jgi:HD-like signal output (HDOD) protein
MKILEIDLPPDTPILVQARINASRPALPMRDLSNLIVHDPVTSLAFFHTANSVMYAGTASLTSIESVLPRLGINKITKILNELHDRPDLDNERVADAFEVLRYNCRRTSIISLIISTVLQPQKAEVARLSGLFSDVGHMITLLKLGETYCDLVEAHGRGSLAYRIEKEHKFNLKNVHTQYLQARGVPEAMWVAYDEEAQKQSKDLKTALIVKSAVELIEAADGGRIEKFSPEEKLPARSSLRLLDVNAANHKKIYSTCVAYLKKFEEEAPEGAGMLLTTLEEEPIEQENPLDQPIKIPTYPSPQIKARSQQKLQAFFELCESEKDETALQKKTVAALVGEGLFSRAALIRVDSANSAGIIVEGANFGLQNGATFPIENELSPFYHFRVQIKSTNIQQAGTNIPFDESAYALGPIGRPSDEDRLVLYADAAGQGSLTMEMRKIFRLVLTLLTEAVSAARATAEGESESKAAGTDSIGAAQPAAPPSPAQEANKPAPAAPAPPKVAAPPPPPPPVRKAPPGKPAPAVAAVAPPPPKGGK